MDFKILFYCLVAFIVGRLSKLKVYIGYDKEKYQEADLAIKLRE